MQRKQRKPLDSGFYMRIRTEDLTHMRNLAQNAGKKLTAYIRDCALTAKNHRIVANRDSEESESATELYSVSPSPLDTSEAKDASIPLDNDETKELSTVSRSFLVSERTGHKVLCRCEACTYMRSLLPAKGNER